MYTCGTTGPPKGVVSPRARSRRTSTRSPTRGRGPARRARPRAPAVPRPRPRVACSARCASAAGPPPRPLRPGGDRRGARGRRDDAVRRPDDVPPHRRRGRGATRRSPTALRARAPARLRLGRAARRRPRRASSALTGQRIVERYGMTETLMITLGPRRRRAARRLCRAARSPASSVRLVGDAGEPPRPTTPRSATSSCAAQPLRRLP